MLRARTRRHICAPWPSKPPAPSRRIPARAYDPCTKHRGSQSSKAPQPEVRGDHPRCSHTQCRHAPQAWGAKTPSHFMWLLCPLPNPASHQSASSPSDLLHGARLCKQPAARPSQRQPSSAARTGSVQQPTVSQSSCPQFVRRCAYRHTPPSCQSGRTQPRFDSNSTPSATSEPFATQMVPEGRSVGSRGQRSNRACGRVICTRLAHKIE